MQYTVSLLLAFGAIIAITSTPNVSSQPLPTASAETASITSVEIGHPNLEAQPAQTTAPATQSATSASAPAVSAPVQTPQAKGAPVRVKIPAIGLNAPIVRVGTNSAGEMDVPSGNTNNIGWYSKGVVPGDIGSAVFAAHVFAALGNLHKTELGDEIFVESENGGYQRFVVTKTDVYKLGDLSPDMLFNRKDGRHLHLITCAGTPTSDGSTYTHRLVVYATLAP